MLAVWGESSPHLADAVPALQPVGDLLGEQPAVGGIPYRVQGGSAGRNVVGLIEILTTPGVPEIVGDHNLRSVAAYGCADGATQPDAVFEYAIRQPEKVDSVNAHDPCRLQLLGFAY